MEEAKPVAKKKPAAKKAASKPKAGPKKGPKATTAIEDDAMDEDSDGEVCRPHVNPNNDLTRTRDGGRRRK